MVMMEIFLNKRTTIYYILVCLAFYRKTVLLRLEIRIVVFPFRTFKRELCPIKNLLTLDGSKRGKIRVENLPVSCAINRNIVELTLK